MGCRQEGVMRGGRVPCAVCVLVLFGACVTLPIPSPPPVSPIKVVNSMDYWSQQSIADFLKVLITDMETKSNTAFGSAAYINFAWNPRNQFLPDLNPGQPDQWPDIQANRQFYFTYVQNQYNQPGPTPGAFRTFFITHLQGNPSAGTCPGTGVPFTLGVSVYPSANQVDSTEPLNRMTFLYVDDIVHIGDACITQGQSMQTPTVAVAVLTHELGHQRAGLTHASGQNAMPQFHQGTYGPVPLKKFDVMSSGQNLVQITTNGDPAFDMLDSYPHDNDMTTCQGILNKWRTITN